MKDTVSVGSLSEAKILARFIEIGWEVLISWRRMRRYDFVIEKDGKFYRVQCKTAQMSKDKSGILFATSNVNGSSRVRRNYVGAVDFFAVYCRETDKVYLVPMTEDLGTVSCRLRFTPPRNNQEKDVRYAKDYEL